MRLFTRLIAFGSAGLLATGLANAQVPQPGQGATVLGSAPGTTSPGPTAPAPGAFYNHNWAAMHGDATLVFTGLGLFGFQTGSAGNFAGFQDSIRTCYGVDATQGGRNQSDGDVGGPFRTGPDGIEDTQVTWFRLNQSWQPLGSLAGINVGFISIYSGTSSNLGGDACFSPFFQVAGNTGGHKHGTNALGGLFGGTSPAGFPVVWELSFSWGPTTVKVPNTVGNSLGDAGISTLALGPQHFPPVVPGHNPLLANVIFEVQGPLNGPALGAAGTPAIQYYLSSTIEWAGIGDASGGANAFGAPLGSGGVANNMDARGAAIFVGGPLANATGLLSHTRIFGFHVVPPVLAVAGAPPALATPLGSGVFRTGRVEFVQSIAFNTPFLYSERIINHTPGTPNPTGNGVIRGAGGPDWRISSPPLSTIDIRSIDHVSGGLINSNVNAKVPTSYTTGGGGTIPPIGSAAHVFSVPGFISGFNRATFLWGITGNNGMLTGQQTAAWDAVPHAGAPFFGAFAPAVRGDSAFGPQVSTRISPAPSQTIPIISDTATTLFIGSAALTFATGYTASDDFFLDGTIGTATFFSSLFEGSGFLGHTSGRSDLKPAGVGTPIGIPDPTLAGVNLYIASSSSHLVFPSLALVPDEIHNALTVTLQ